MLYVLTRRRGAKRRMLRILNAPEECPHGTHTSGTVSTHEAPTREYTHKHPQTQTNTQSTLYHGLRSSRPSPIIAEIATHRRTSTRPTAGGWSTSPPSRSTRSLMPDRARRRSRPPPVRRAPRPAPRRPTCRSRRTAVGRPLPLPPTSCYMCIICGRPHTRHTALIGRSFRRKTTDTTKHAGTDDGR